MLIKNLCFVLSILLLLVISIRAGDNTIEKLTRRCRENERRALWKFKAGVVDDFGILSSWEGEEECCNWRGIRCSNQTGHVTGLNLPDSGLVGKVSPAISELKHLKYLNLSFNGFTGEIPHQLGNLTNLRSLDLASNSNNFYELTSENLDRVSNLHLLTLLDLTMVDLSNCTGWLNPIYKLTYLAHLHLSFCRLPDHYNPSLSINTTSFSALNALAVVDLSRNEFISPWSYTWLFNFTTTLIYLDLSYNSFPSSQIPEAFGRMISLESLFLSSCNFEGTLPDSFMNLSRLAILDLNNNSFNGSLAEFLHPLATKEKNSIKVLNLCQNQLYGFLPDYISSRFTSIQEMLISNNKLSGPFPDNFWQLSSTLFHLDLSYNQITGQLPNLTLFSSLERLILSNNKLEDIVLEAYLSNLSKLSILDLSFNSFSFAFSFDWLPPFQLDILFLKNCTLGPQFPNWITLQHNISVLDISDARISDTIPLQFWDLSPRLKALNMSNNQIRGILPSISFPDILWIDLSNNLLQGQIPPLPLALEFLDLAHNMFTGSLSFICTSPLTQLYYLDLSSNKLSGELPARCLMNSHQLGILNLANNDFSGNIPPSIGLLSQLEILQLRTNNFTGPLPLSLSNITDLQILDLSENKLSWKVPFWIGTHLTSLVVLSLRSNEFSGSIPLQICHLTNAQVLDFSQNHLTGSIPYCIDNLTSLVDKETNNEVRLSVWVYGDDTSGDQNYRYADAVVQWKGVTSEYERNLKYLKLIDLSSNRLVGEIPMEIVSLKGLISLNLSSNSLTGNIVLNIGQMENLENLDLSRNHLSGKIPSGLASLTFLSVLDLSNNNLTGKIPTSTQLQGFDPSKYAGNEQLCGLPLPNKCGGEHSNPTGNDAKDESSEQGDDNFPKFWLYVVWLSVSVQDSGDS